MRFDKNIWAVECAEYSQNRGALDVSYFTESSKVFVSLWLEVLQDFRAPITRQLHELSVVDLADELLRAIELWSKLPQTAYRVVNLAERLKRSLARLGTTHPAAVEADRYLASCDLFVEFVQASKKERVVKDQNSIWPRACSTLGFPTDLNGGNPKAEEVFRLHLRSIAVAMRGALESRDAFVEWLLDELDKILQDANLSLSESEVRLDSLVRELLAHALRRGFSREHLAELPIKFLRADNDRLAQRELSDRVGLMLGTFRGAKQRYEAIVPLVGAEVEIDGKILPEGISLKNWPEWSQFLSSHDQTHFSDSQAFHLDIDRLLEQEFVAQAFRPHDLFAAREIALKSVRRCLDVVFLLRRAVPKVAPSMLVLAHNADGAGQPYSRVLDLHREFVPDSIHLKYLRSVPAEWVDALHWFREGVEDPSDEVGIVNLWTSLELLSLRSPRLVDSDAERVRRTVGELAAIGLLADEVNYFDSASRNAAASGASTSWCDWIDASEAEITQEFAAIPHLAGVFASVSSAAIAADRLDEIRDMVHSILLWAYGCRNDIVHEGRRQLPGASILRDALAAIARAALTLTLSLESRGCAASLEDAFFWAEQETQTLRETGRTQDLEAVVSRIRSW